MFTVKLIDLLGQEDLITATSVTLGNKAFGEGGTGKPFPKELRIVHDGVVTIVDSGFAYVMNDNGKTVADYSFVEQQAPQLPMSGTYNVRGFVS